MLCPCYINYFQRPKVYTSKPPEKTVDKLFRKEVRDGIFPLDRKNLWQRLWSSWPLVLYICTLRNKLHSHQIKVICSMWNDANKINNEVWEHCKLYSNLTHQLKRYLNIIQITINAFKILSAFHSLRDIFKKLLKLLPLITVTKKLKMLLERVILLLLSLQHIPLKATENVRKWYAMVTVPLAIERWFLEKTNLSMFPFQCENTNVREYVQ